MQFEHCYSKWTDDILIFTQAKGQIKNKLSAHD